MVDFKHYNFNEIKFCYFIEYILFAMWYASKHLQTISILDNNEYKMSFTQVNDSQTKEMSYY